MKPLDVYTIQTIKNPTGGESNMKVYHGTIGFTVRSEGRVVIKLENGVCYHNCIHPYLSDEEAIFVPIYQDIECQPPTVQCLLGTNQVAMQNPYEFNEVASSEYDKIGMGVGIYTFEGVTAAHPIGFVIDDTDLFEVIEGTPHLTPKLIDNISVQHYTGTVKVEVKDDFGVISYNCYNHGYMGGKDGLVYEETCTYPNPTPTFNLDYDVFVATTNPQDIGEFQTGSVTLYGAGVYNPTTNPNYTLSLVSKIFPPDEESFPFIEYGTSVSFNYRYLMVSSPWQWVVQELPLGDGEFETNEVESAGKVYVYDLSNELELKLTLTPEEPEESMGFGTMLDSSDRYIAVATDTSEVYIYDITDNWNQQTRITEWSNRDDKNIKSIAVSNEYLVVGITNTDETGGQLHLYKRDDDLGGEIVSVSGWSGKLDGVNADFVGKTVAIDKDSNIVVTGWTNIETSTDNIESINVSIWQASPDGLEYLETLTKDLTEYTNLSPTAYGDVNVDISGDAIIVGVPMAGYTTPNANSGFVYKLIKTVGGWEEHSITAGAGVNATQSSFGEKLFGRHVRINDGAFIFACDESAYVYKSIMATPTLALTDRSDLDIL